MAVKNYGIRDQWTNLDKLNNVDIKSVDGVIESVKINGEEAGGGGGSSDFSTAEVTIVKTGSFDIYLPFCYDDEDIHQTDFIVNHDGTYRAILYKGGCFGNVTPRGLDDPNIEVTGDIDVDSTDLYIFGDCTITIS